MLYGVGTGPGDPELLTVKAVRTIESCPVIAAPQTADGVMVALDLTPEMSSPLHIVPGGYDDVRRAIGWPGTKVVMKARRSLADTKRILREEGAFDGAELVEDCGLPGERVYRSLDDVPDRGSYFSTMVVR
ncbi:SAM-dependent methyltransferase [Ellagibacter isourolithinifaciens]|uniref:SAM-dependent methyltransferase n=1 Tax=Ellagibacter isourolithinifaciens TaxID=2137581 RepID=UPI001FE4D91F|nr:SAM-dependent methyltransferase [Ellagibacter isourolithinifaciens]